VTASGGDAGLLTREAPPDGTTTVNYSFTATNPGTYMYHSGTNMDLQIEMGLVGALIVRSGMAPQDTLVTPGHDHPLTSYAYDHADTAYEREYLFLLTEMVPDIHRLVEFGEFNKIDTSDYFAKSWFINGRNAMDDMAEPDVPWFPTQPYNCMPMMHPGEKVLARVIGAGRDLHPFHFHGNDVRVIARDGRLLSSAPGAGPDLAYNDYTVMSVPGQTYDAIFQWTGKDLGWDAYGHAAGDALQPYEWAPDHGKPFPVTLPPVSAMALGDLWSGSPFLGATGDLPPGHPALNMAGGYNYMWHSHSEKELTSNDIFPGGMMTFMMVVPWGVSIP
jgi:FtsP/CotA-like multicopper oxidase with cupredoxin domain